MKLMLPTEHGPGQDRFCLKGPIYVLGFGLPVVMAIVSAIGQLVK